MSSSKRPIDEVAGDTKAEEEPDTKKAAKDDNGDDTGPSVVEEGRLAFFYRPKVEMKEAHSVDDVQRFYMLMSPTREGAQHRLVAVGKKRLPKADTHERFYGFVTAVDKDKSAITAGLQAQTNETKTRGTRHTGPARAAGEAWYEIVLRDKTGPPGREATSLAYRLEVPEEPGDVQRELGIAKQASLQIRLKNPDRPDPPNVNAGLAQKAAYKDEPEKKKQFQGYAWIAVEDPSLLDYQNAEMVLIGERADTELNLGEAAEHLKEAAKEDVKVFMEDYDGEEHDALVAKLREEVNADQDGLSVEPAATGEWK